MKILIQFILTLSFFFPAFQSQAVESGDAIKALTNGNWMGEKGMARWDGTFRVKLVPPRRKKFNANNIGLPSPRQKGHVVFSVDPETGLLQYIFQRPTSSEKTETDYMICNEDFPGYSLPRKLVFPNDMARLKKEGKLKEIMDSVEVMFNDPEFYLHEGSKKGFEITDTIYIVTVGKKCGKNDKGKKWDELENLIYPDHNIEWDDKGLRMGAILPLIGDSLQGYTFYEMVQTQ